MTKNCKLFSIILMAITFFAMKPAFAECDGFYLAARAGATKYHIDNNHTTNLSDYAIDKRRFLASGALGYRYKHVRAEVEYLWRRKNKETVIGVSEARFQAQSFMFILYYDFFPYYWFTPYVDAGAGYTHNKTRYRDKIANTSFSSKDDNFTWSLGAGLSAKITNRLNLDVGYRYYDVGEITFHNGKSDANDQEVYVGLRYIM